MTRPLAALALANLALATGLGASVPAQQAAPPAPPPCATVEHRQFDFWLGDWDVEARGRLAGRNRISRLFGDCGLREEYVGARGGYTGSSFNLFDATRGVWHQTWIDNQGQLLLLEGGLVDGLMVLGGRQLDAEGKSAEQRITWTPNADGTVRQLWEQSTDGGATWTTLFDGHYRRRTPD